MCCGILRAVGAQLYSSVIVFFSFYVIGASVGLILLLRSTLHVYGKKKEEKNFQFEIILTLIKYINWKILGFYIGIFFAELVLVSLQVFYIKNINWKKIAQATYESNKEVTYNSVSNQAIVNNGIKNNENDFKIVFKSAYETKEKFSKIRKDVYFQMFRIFVGFLVCFTVFLLSIYSRYL